MIRNGYQQKSNPEMLKRRDHTPITGKKVKNQVTKIPSKKENGNVQRINFISKKQFEKSQNSEQQTSKQYQNRVSFYDPSKNLSNSNAFQKSILSKINGMNENRINTQSNNINTSTSNASVIISQVKQMGNKSVLIVKPNQLGMNNESALSQSRSTKRRVVQNDNKQNRFSLNKDNSLLKNDTKDSSYNNNNMKSSKVNNFFKVDTNYEKGNNNNNNSNMNNTDRQVKVLRRQDNNNNVTGGLTRNGNGNTQSMNMNNNNNNKNSSSSLSSKLMGNQTTKVRSNSTRITRKQELSSSGINNTSISKNHSYTSKGKWKM